MSTTKKTQGLADVVAGESAICSVSHEGCSLYYRGYGIDQLAAECIFEEICYLLIHGVLPTRNALDAYCLQLQSYRSLPQEIFTLLESIPFTTSPMEMLRTAVSFLGNISPEQDEASWTDTANRLIAAIPVLLCDWYHFHTQGEHHPTTTTATTTADYILKALDPTTVPQPLAVKALNVSLILYAEHEFNASTFAARVTTATLSDFYSAVCSAIGTLRGPLHGGANEEALKLLLPMENTAAAANTIHHMLAQKQRIMGFGHRVYTVSDPRSAIIQAYAKQLASPHHHTLYQVAETVEQLMWQEKRLFPNLDFYSAVAYHASNIPISLFTPLFVCSRISGWGAHIIEQRTHNALIRPISDYTGPSPRPFVTLNDR